MRYSVIIPVYNCREYLKAAVDSVADKEGKTEIILVDDGSTDGSGELCDELASNCENLLVYHTENFGAGSARNTGAEKATGDYVIFLDSDDILSQDFFENIYIEEDCDVIFFPTVKFYPNGTKIPMDEGFSRSNINGASKLEILDSLTKFNKFPASCAGKIIRRKFLTENNICFPEEKFAEDIDWTLNMLILGKNFRYYDKGTYFYRQVNNSRSSRGNKKSVEDLIYIIQKWEMKSKDCPYKEYILSYLAYEYAMVFPFLGALGNNDRKLFLDSMRKLRYLLRFGKTKKLRAIRMCVNVFGISITAKILNYYVSKRDKVGEVVC